MNTAIRVEWVYDVMWKERRDAGIGPHVYEFAETRRMSSEQKARQAHDSARQFKWVQDGWFAAYVSPLRKVETDLDQRGRATRRSHSREVADAAYGPKEAAA